MPWVEVADLSLPVEPPRLVDTVEAVGWRVTSTRGMVASQASR
jgi:hypothetical protein